MTHIHSYPSVFALGHKMVLSIFNDPVQVEEKVDGSQFSFGISKTGDLICRSKGQDLIIDAPEKMFALAVQTVLEIAPALHPGWIYRGEYLQKPKHNAICYSRVPQMHIIGFDINTGDEVYMTYAEKKSEFERLGLETVPMLYRGMVENMAMLKEFLERESILGGSKIEGVVVKNYDQFTPDKKAMFGKFVSEHFKEVMSGEWKKANPTSADILQQLIDSFKTEARWQKAIQHCRENGTIEGSPRDIGTLMKEISQDTHKECEDEIKQILFDYYWPKVSRGITSGLPQWYKEQLAKASFE